MTAAEWLAAKRRSYWEDGRRLVAMGDEDVAGLTGEQWGAVYRAVAEELGKCATEVDVAELHRDFAPNGSA